MRTVFVTGAAGFIGANLCYELIRQKYNVIGLDNINNYYDITLKNARLKRINNFTKKNNLGWKFIKGDIENKNFLEEIFKNFRPEVVIHLAAQAGVRYSIKNPSVYVSTNLTGFNNVIECCRNFLIKNFIYASSSSVYGGNKKIPFSEKDPVDHPISLYAATKRSNELVAHTYSHLYGLPSTGLRFFTVYGPWGRPDMAPMIFTKNIISKKPIKIFNYGKMFRDFTYVDDVTEAILKLINKPATSEEISQDILNPSLSWALHKIFNLGNSNSVSIMEFIEIIEDELDIKAVKEFTDIKPGDVEITAADTEKLNSWIGYKPSTSIKKGIREFVKWYKFFYKIEN